MRRPLRLAVLVSAALAAVSGAAGAAEPRLMLSLNLGLAADAVPGGPLIVTGSLASSDPAAAAPLRIARARGTWVEALELVLARADGSRVAAPFALAGVAADPALELAGRARVRLLWTLPEVVLYESSHEILFQYADLDAIVPQTTVGIEDADGNNGYPHPSVVQVDQDIRFIRPPIGPHVKVLPRLQGGFAIEFKAQHRVRIVNNGESGADRYNLSTLSSGPGWQAKFYDITGQLPLVDTNGDAIIDTGLLNPGSAVTLTLKIDAPAIAAPGDYTTLVFTASSTLAATSRMTGTVQSAVPVQFSQIYVNGGAIRMSQIWKKSIIDRQTADYTGKTFSMEALRILLVMATGTGKTYTAFQIIWRLWKSKAKKASSTWPTATS